MVRADCNTAKHKGNATRIKDMDPSTIAKKTVAGGAGALVGATVGTVLFPGVGTVLGYGLGMVVGGLAGLVVGTAAVR